MNEEKMKFLINATHDIRSPLTLIMSPLANLKRRISDSQSDAKRDLDTIEHNATRILNLVNQILDVRKIDKQQMHLHCQQTDLVNFVRGIYKMFEFNAKERNIKFNLQHDGFDELDVWVDRSQFDKVVTNLLSNAFKYSFDGGTIDVRLHPRCRDTPAAGHRQWGRARRRQPEAHLRPLLSGQQLAPPAHRRHGHRPEPLQDDCRHAPRHHRGRQPHRRTAAPSSPSPCPWATATCPEGD